MKDIVSYTVVGDQPGNLMNYSGQDWVPATKGTKEKAGLTPETLGYLIFTIPAIALF